MSKKKTIIVSVTALIVLTALSGFAFVATVGSCSAFSGHRGKGFHKKGMPFFMQEEVSQFLLWRMDKAAEMLELTSSQNVLYSHLKENVKETMEKGIQARSQIKTISHNEMEKELPDITMITEEIKEHLNTMAGMMDRNLALFHSFYQSLDSEQKNMINQKIKTRFEEHHRLAFKERQVKK